MLSQEKGTVEVRGFLQLAGLFKSRKWSIPLVLEIEEPITGAELAEKLEIPLEEVEIIFINGFAHRPADVIQPGDRVAFVPPGCPGPYRLHLGFYGKNDDNEYSFRKKDE